MPPKKNDILKDVYIGWTTKEGEVIGKVKYSALTADGFSCEVELTDIKKEKNMKYDLKNVTSISIERSDDDGTVTATAYGRDPYCKGRVAVIKRASAKCGPNDIYDFNIGAKLALDRLYEGYDMTPKPKRKPYNGKIFVEEYPGAILRDHRIYQVNNGRIDMFMCQGCHEYIFDDMTDLDLSFAICHHLYDKNCDPTTFNLCVRAFFIKE